MNPLFPKGYRLETITRAHPRAAFRSGVPEVDVWLHTKAFQAEAKHLATTKILLDETGAIAGYYTLAQHSVNFSLLPPALAKGLPTHHTLPSLMLAWLGIREDLQGQGQNGLGERLFAQALAHLWSAGQEVPFIAVFVDCLNDRAKKFYLRFGLIEMPDQPMQLCLPWAKLEAMMNVSSRP